VARKWLQSADVEVGNDGALLVKDSADSVGSASSGLVAKATVSDVAVECIAANANVDFHHLRIVNEGGVAGFFSFDGGATWHRLVGVTGAVTAIVLDGILIHNAAVQVKRIAGGTNLTAIFVSVW
jgi:hypothetical protein